MTGVDAKKPRPVHGPRLLVLYGRVRPRAWGRRGRAEIKRRSAYSVSKQKPRCGTRAPGPGIGVDGTCTADHEAIRHLLGFAKLARTWIRLAEDLEKNQAFLSEVSDETEPDKRTA